MLENSEKDLLSLKKLPLISNSITNKQKHENSTTLSVSQ